MEPKVRGLPAVGAPMAPARAMAGLSLLYCAVNAVAYGWAQWAPRASACAAPAAVCRHMVMAKKSGQSWLCCGPAAPPGPAQSGIAEPGDVWLWSQHHWQLERGAMPGAARLALGLPLLLNQASATELAHVPGLGRSLAQRVVADRAAHGHFATQSDLLRVPGLGPSRLAAAQQSLVVVGQKW